MNFARGKIGICRGGRFGNTTMLVRGGDSERLHFAIEVAAFQAESRRRLRHVPAMLLQFAQDEFALVGATRLMQR